MSQNFVKGRTNNHLTWVMVGATDFATPYSAASAATKIKIYGKLRGATGVNFVSSGTGSLTNDIVHVGASALGLYTIALAKADLSDASAAWYDQYIISLSCTGCAYQTLVADGGIDASAASAFQSRLSDIYSMLSDMQSDFQSRVPKLVANNSQLSDLASDLRSVLIVNQSTVSDLYSLLSDMQSDFQSRVPKRVATDSQLSDMASDIKSAVVVVQSMASDAASAAQQANSRILLVQSRLSDLDSRLVSDVSDVLSGTRSLRSALIGKEGSTASATGNASTVNVDGIDHASQFNGYWIKVVNGSQTGELRLVVDTDKTASRLTVKPAFKSALASGVDFVLLPGSPDLSHLLSDLKSAVVVVQSMASDAASAAQQANSRVLVTQSLASDALSAATAAASRALINQSRISDVQSFLSDFQSDLLSHLDVTGVQLNASTMSDLRSAVAAVTASVSASDISDIASAVWANAIGARVDSRILVNKSAISDVYSLLSDHHSDFQSRVPKLVATNSQLSHLASDLKSAVQGITVSLDASNISDIASAVVAALPITSMVSDIYSLLSDLQSDFQSRVPKRVATDSQLSDMASDIKSAVTVVQSMASDAASAAAQANSRTLVVQSQVSDVYSLLSDHHSDFQSRVPKAVATNSQLSDLASDLRSYLVGLSATLSDVYSLASDLQSDFQSRVPKRVATDSQVSDLLSDLKSAVTVVQSMASDAASAAQQGASRALVVQSAASDIYSLLSDHHSDFQSRVPKLVATSSQLSDLVSDAVSDLKSFVGAGVPADASTMSDLRSAVAANGVLRAGADPTAVVGVTDTLAAKVDFLAALSRNKITQTATKQTLLRDDGTTVAASAVVSDDGTTATRGEFG